VVSQLRNVLGLTPSTSAAALVRIPGMCGEILTAVRQVYVSYRQIYRNC
jgi:hypothetical protein